jgi:hypothetical protein
VLVPPLDPGVALGALLALADGGRVGGQDGTAGGGAQLPGGLAGGVRENLLFNGGRMVVAEASDLVGDDSGPVAVDAPGGQRGHRGRQAMQCEGDIEQDVRGSSSECQGGGDLIIALPEANWITNHAGAQRRE